MSCRSTRASHRGRRTRPDPRASRITVWVTVFILSPLAAHAAPPLPITADLFSFPGGFMVPTSARSTALALADRWLGDDPAGNPAGAFGQVVVLSPMLLHVSRQDLRAANRDFDEQPAFFDAAGGWISGPFQGAQLVLYAHQPVARTEDNAFTRGRIFDPGVPAVVQSQSSAREVRGGLAASVAIGSGRIGVAGEWTHREDRYETIEQSGSPESGERRVTLSGDAFGGQVGGRFEWGPVVGEQGERQVTVAAALRLVSELSADVGIDYALLVGDSSSTSKVDRESGFEGGLSAQVRFNRVASVLLGLGGRSEQTWKQFGVVSGAGAQWAIAGEFQDPNEPWTFRIGYGIEHQEGVPEARANLLGLGLGYAIEGGLIELGLLRRSYERGDHPTSFEDRVVGTVRIRL